MPDCPTDADLAAFLDDSLPAGRTAVVAEHVDACPGCLGRMDKLTRHSDTVAARYRDLSAVTRTGRPGAGGRPPAADPRPDDATWDAPAFALAAHFRSVGLPDIPGFEVAAEIGRGGMGVVYRARHRGLNRLVAVKTILGGGAADPDTVRRFIREAQILGQVRHPQVVQVYEVDTFPGPHGTTVPYLAMELLEGGSLGELLKAGPRPAVEAAELVEGIARAVHAVHLQGVVHRDLKPGNILFGSADIVSRPGESGDTAAAGADSAPPAPHAPGLAKVSDFGLAKFAGAGAADLTATGQVVGTPAYMAPEQATGARTLGPAADVYALGAILYECLTGRRPFEGGDLMSVLHRVVNDPPAHVRAVRPDVPRDLAAVAMKCLEKDPRRRYESGGDLADDLHRFRTKRPTIARPPTRRERLWLWAERRPAEAVLLTALAVIIATAFVLVSAQWRRAEQEAADELAAHAAATRAHGETAAALAEATRLRDQSELREARLTFNRAISLARDGQTGHGLARLARALELADAGGEAALGRVARVNLAAWRAELPPPRRDIKPGPTPRRVAFTPDGGRMVVAGHAASVSLWDAETRAKLRTYAAPARRAAEGGGFAFLSVAVSHDGRTVAAGGTDGRVRVWDIDGDDPTAVLEAAPGGHEVRAVAFAPDGKVWATDGANGFKLWDIAACRAVLEAAPPGGHVECLAVSPDGSRVYTGDRGGVVREWDAAGGERRKWTTGGAAADVAVAPAGDAILIVGAAGVCREIDVRTGATTRDFDLAGGEGTGAAFAAGGTTVVVAESDGTVRVWDRRTGQTVGPPVRFAGALGRPSVRPHSAEVAVPAGDAVSLFRPPEPRDVPLGDGAAGPVRGLEFDATGERVAVAAGRRVDVYDARTGAKRRTVDVDGETTAIRFDPARPRVIRAAGGTLETIDLATGKRTPAVTADAGRIDRVAFLPGGSAFVTLGAGELSQWDADGLRRVARVPATDVGAGSDTRLTALAVRPGGAEVLASFGPRVAFLDAATFAPVRPPWTAPDEVTAARYTPDGSKVFAGLRNGSAVLFDVATGAAAAFDVTHGRAITAVAISPDGAVLLTASRDGTARFWDAETGLPLGPALRHDGPVTRAAYSPAGDRVATATAAGQARVWLVPPAPLAGTPAEVADKVKEWVGEAKAGR